MRMETVMHARTWRVLFNAPNIISLARLASLPPLLFWALAGYEAGFVWLLLAAFVSDIADGLVARIFRLKTAVGAALDSIADVALYVSVPFGLFRFRMDFLQAHVWEILAVGALFLLTRSVNFLRYRIVFNSFHPYLARFQAYALGIFVMTLFFYGYEPVLFYTAFTLMVVQHVEEIILLLLLPENEVNVRGLFWVLAKKGPRGDGRR